MLAFSKRFHGMLAVIPILLFQMDVKMARCQGQQYARASSASQAVSLVVWTDQTKYSLGNSVKVSTVLQNNGDKTVYVDRRMFWTGFGGGLKLEIRDERGRSLPAHPLSDAIMPPPRERDTSILIPLDEGFLYGTSVNLLVKDFFPRPGKYSIRVVYKSWLRKGFVASELRDLPALWADSPEVVSEPVLIDIAP